MPSTLFGATCSGCMFFDPNLDPLTSKPRDSFPGACRAHPPALIGDPDGASYSRWPTVYPEHWCGEWIARKVPR